MAIQVLSDDKYSRRKRPQVSLNFALKRLAFNKAARNLMVDYFKDEFENIIFLIDDQRTDVFWVKPCNEDNDDARHLNRTVGGTRTCSCSLLLEKLNWQSNETGNFALSYDSEIDAFRVDISQKEKGGDKT